MSDSDDGQNRLVVKCVQWITNPIIIST